MTSLRDLSWRDETGLFDDFTEDSLPIVVINLDRDCDRWRRMRALLDNFSLRALRVPAVDAAAFTSAQRDALARSDQSASPTAVAVFLSHRKVWSALAASSFRWAVILEDDLHFSEAASRLLKSSAWLPQQADLIKIETFHRKILVSNDYLHIDGAHKLRFLNSKHVGTGGYIVASRAASHLIESSQQITIDVDQFLFNPAISPVNDLVRMQIDPALCIQDQNLPSSLRVGIISGLAQDRKSWISTHNSSGPQTKERKHIWTRIQRRVRKARALWGLRFHSNVKKRIRIRLKGQCRSY
ncbi:MAG: glycosyltransferase family 25 protein [Pseudomonadota bacterium]